MTAPGKAKLKSESPTRDKGARGRSTATFEAYYWEAYNAIVEPRRWDHYLLRRWLPTLGPLGFALVKVLRDRCYFNPDTGVLRDTCEIDMDELAHLIGVSRATLFRELGRNVALGCFVRRVEQYQMINGRPQQTRNLYQVCMDDPVHPDDRERYEALRQQKETEREQPLPCKIIKREKQPPYGSQSATHNGFQSAHESQFATHESQFATPVLPSQIETAYTTSPSGDLFTKEFLTAAPAPSHKCVPPGGEQEEEPHTPDPCADLCVAAWQEALKLLASQVNKPTYEAHLRPLRLACVSEAGEALLLAPHASTREWIEKRHKDKLEEALRRVLGRDDVTVRLSLAAAPAVDTK